MEVQNGFETSNEINGIGNFSVKNNPEIQFSLPPILDLEVRAKTSHRMHYEAQIEVIKKQIGDLESIRGQLGLTQRKMAQLLMVDPSAWTRWTKNRDQVPPHIYRALQWYMTVQEKIPGLTPQYFLGNFASKDSSLQNRQILQRIDDLESRNLVLRSNKEELEAQIAKLSLQVQANRVGFFMVVIGALIMAGTLFWRMRG